MQTGGYAANRLLPTFVRSACDELGLTVQGLSGDWVFRVSNQAVTKNIIGYKFDINQAAAAAISTDKVATYQVLSLGGVAAVEHQLFRTGSMPILQHNTTDGVVVKPLTGTSGKDVSYFATTKEAHDHMQKSYHKAWAVSPYVKIVKEVRVIVLDTEILLIYEKRLQSKSKEFVLFNLSEGATPHDVDASQQDVFIDLAIRARQMLGLRLGSVDCVVLEDGDIKILEVNESITMEWYARASSQNYQKTQQVYYHIIAAMMDC